MWLSPEDLINNNNKFFLKLVNDGAQVLTEQWPGAIHFLTRWAREIAPSVWFLLIKTKTGETRRHGKLTIKSVFVCMLQIYHVYIIVRWDKQNHEGTIFFIFSCWFHKQRDQTETCKCKRSNVFNNKMTGDWSSVLITTSIASCIVN